MAYENAMHVITAVAGADLSAAQYKFVKLNTTANQVVLCGDGEDGDGVLQNDPTSGQAATVCIGGVTKVLLGGTVAAGGVVSSGAAGIANASANGDYMLGKALTGGASGEIATIIFAKNGVDPA